MTKLIALTDDLKKYFIPAFERKAKSITGVNVEQFTSYTDVLIIIEGSSQRQVSSIAQHLIKRLKEKKIKAIGVEGVKEGEWALLDYGFKVIIAPSFADIFYNNCFKNGILPIVLDEDMVQQLFQKSGGEQALEITVDLENQKLVLNDGSEISFEVDSFRKHCLLEGLDDIGLTLQHVDEIRAYEERRKQEAPWLFTNPAI